MDNEILEDFKKVLDNDEEILLSFKPNKKRFVTLQLIFSSAFLLLFFSLFFVLGILGLSGIVPFVNESTGEPDRTGPLLMIIFVSFPLGLVLISSIITRIVRYRRVCYVVTNKRIVIRSGFIGVDYKSLSLSAISVINVRVDFIDKLCNPNTGTIIFASAALPMNNNSQQNQYYNFVGIEDPYESYKRIKEIASTNANKQF